MSNPETGYFVIDIEKAGSKYEHALLAIGVCFGDSAGNIFMNGTFVFPIPDDSQFEERCIKEFWSRPGNKKTLERIRVASKMTKKNQETALTEFNYMLDNAEKRFPGRSLSIVTDNPSFDLPHIDYLNEKFDLRKNHVRYTTQDVYRNVTDPSERLEALGMYNHAKSCIGKKAPHDHWPSNDAKHIYYLQLAANACEDYVITHSNMKSFEEALSMEVERIAEKIK